MSSVVNFQDIDDNQENNVVWLVNHVS